MLWPATSRPLTNGNRAGASRQSCGRAYNDLRGCPITGKIAKARIAELELQEKEGALVSRERINAQLFAAGKELRDTLLAIPDRITDVVMAEDNRAIIHNTIYDAIADALQKLADFQTRIDQ